ncbi:hypothetical protein [Roseateles sp. L2-2]|uniref:hypothetical protein n=1 Tax=Roseateles TaxID=93681 RepID=UPI003D36F486
MSKVATPSGSSGVFALKNHTQVSGSELLGRATLRGARWASRLGLIVLTAVTLGAHAQSGATLEEAMANERAKRVKPSSGLSTRSAISTSVAGDPGEGGPTSFDPANYFENGKLIRAPKALSMLGPDLFGDRVNLYRGTLEFVQTDVNLDGNNALPVAVTRRLSTGSRGNYGQGLFSEWELEIPHMQGTFHGNLG